MVVKLSRSQRHKSPKPSWIWWLVPGALVTGVVLHQLQNNKTKASPAPPGFAPGFARDPSRAPGYVPVPPHAPVLPIVAPAFARPPSPAHAPAHPPALTLPIPPVPEPEPEPEPVLEPEPEPEPEPAFVLPILPGPFLARAVSPAHAPAPASVLPILPGPFLALVRAASPAPDLPAPTCLGTLQGFANRSNSCYMDSLFMALFGVPNPKIDQWFFRDIGVDLRNAEHWEMKCQLNLSRADDIARRQQVQAQMKQTIATLRGEEKKADAPATCSLFRKSLQLCTRPPGADFASGAQQDAGELLQYLLQLFQVNVMTEMTVRQELKGNPKTWQELDRNLRIVTPIVWITPLTYHSPDLTLYLQQSSESKIEPSTASGAIRYIRENIQIEESPFLFFCIQRIRRSGKFWARVINPQEELYFNTGQSLLLTAMVLHTGTNHYICYFRCLKQWYGYDDMNPNKFGFLGSFEKMMAQAKPNPATHATILVYG